MKRNTIWIVAFFVTLSVSPRCLAVKEYYTLSRSLRALGMGGAFYGLSDDEYALFYNPAGLGFASPNFESHLNGYLSFAPSTISALGEFESLKGKSNPDAIDAIARYQGTPLYGNLGLFQSFRNKGFCLGVLIADTKFDLALLGREFDSHADATMITDWGWLVGYAWKPQERLSIGATAKLVHRNGGRLTRNVLDYLDPSAEPGTVLQKGEGIGADLDIGVIYRPQVPWVGRHSQLSLTISNLGASTLPIGRSTHALPPALARTVSAGFFASFSGPSYVEELRLLFDVAEIPLGSSADPHFGGTGGSLLKHLNLGVEAPFNSLLTLRAGLYHGDWTLGLGISLRYLRFDLAVYNEELGSTVERIGSRRVALRIAVGFEEVLTGMGPSKALPEAPPERTLE